MTVDSLHVLIIEDNAQLAANLYDYLDACGHQVDAAPDGPSGFHLAVNGEYDAIVLDWNLPRMDGMTLLYRLRAEERKRVPVIMLTARDRLADKLEGFEKGVDDYLVKPIALPELEARLRTLVARSRPQSAVQTTLHIGDLAFDAGTLEAHRGGRRLTLTPITRRLLALLIHESPNVVSRQRLEQAAWGDAPPDADVLRSHMYLLRRAVEEGAPRKLLHTVSGVGYRLCELP